MTEDNVDIRSIEFPQRTNKASIYNKLLTGIFLPNNSAKEILGNLEDEERDSHEKKKRCGSTGRYLTTKEEEKR